MPTRGSGVRVGRDEWDTMIPDLVVGEFDVILSGMSITAKRES